MSVYIKGFKFPDNCWQCPMVGGYELSDEVKTRYSTLHCRLLKCKTPAGEKPKNCPLIPVPDHGRLIDADKADSRFTPDFTELSDFQCGWNAAMKRVCEDAPTIIEAEEADNG